MGRRMIRLDLTPSPEEDLEIHDHDVAGTVLSNVDEPEEADAVIYLNPVLDQDGCAAALERAIQELRDERFWQCLQDRLGGRE